MTAAFQNTAGTGRYTVDQLGGEACAACGQPFVIGSRPRTFKRVDEWTLFVHRGSCPKAVTAR